MVICQNSHHDKTFPDWDVAAWRRMDNSTAAEEMVQDVFDHDEFFQE